MESRGPWSAVHKVALALGPLRREGKQQGRRGGGLGTSLCIFPLLFLSHSFSPAHSSSFLQPRAFRLFLFLLLRLFAHITFSHIPPWLPAALLASPRSLCCSPRPSIFEVIWPGLPSFRTLSSCHFLFPVRQLSFFLFLCYWNGPTIRCVSPGWAPEPPRHKVNRRVNQTSTQ